MLNGYPSEQVDGMIGKIMYFFYLCMYVCQIEYKVDFMILKYMLLNVCSFWVVSALVWEVHFHPTNPDHLFTCSEDGSLLHWEMTSGSETASFLQGRSPLDFIIQDFCPSEIKHSQRSKLSINDIFIFELIILISNTTTSPNLKITWKYLQSMLINIYFNK